MPTPWGDIHVENFLVGFFVMLIVMRLIRVVFIDSSAYKNVQRAVQKERLDPTSYSYSGNPRSLQDASYMELNSRPSAMSLAADDLISPVRATQRMVDRMGKASLDDDNVCLYCGQYRNQPEGSCNHCGAPKIGAKA